MNQSQNIMLKRKPHLCQGFLAEKQHTNVGKSVFLPTNLVNMVLHMSQSHLPLQSHNLKGVLGTNSNFKGYTCPKPGLSLL